MARVNTYLNFPGNTEEAFSFYKSVFGGEFQGGISRFQDVPKDATTMEIPEEDMGKVMHVSLPIVGGHMLMGTDVTAEQGFDVKFGNNMYISMDLDSKEEVDRLFGALSKGGEIITPLQDMFWGDYYGVLRDKFNVQWMFTFTHKK